MTVSANSDGSRIDGLKNSPGIGGGILLARVSSSSREVVDTSVESPNRESLSVSENKEEYELSSSGDPTSRPEFNATGMSILSNLCFLLSCDGLDFKITAPAIPCVYSWVPSTSDIDRFLFKEDSGVKVAARVLYSPS